MAQPVLVVAHLEVFPGVRAPALRARVGRDGGGFRHLQKVVQLEGFKPRGVEDLALVTQMGLGNPVPQLRDLLDALLHVRTGAEHAEAVLHRRLQLLLQIDHGLARATVVPAVQPGLGLLEIAFACIPVGDALTHHFLDVQTGSAAEHDQVEERVAAEPVRPVHGHACGLSSCVQTRDLGIFALGVLGQSLAEHAGRNSAHHVVARRHDGNRLLDGIHVGKRARELQNSGQPAVEHLLP